jgi:hypothetical protein
MLRAEIFLSGVRIRVSVRQALCRRHAVSAYQLYVIGEVARRI